MQVGATGRAAMQYLRRINLVYLASAPLFLLFLFAALQIALRFWLMMPDNGTLGLGVVDADRLAHGLPVYEDAVTGHATWIYGPFTLAAAAGIFKIFGPSVLAFRLLSFGGAAATIALGLAVSWSKLTPFWRMVALATFVMVDGRVAFLGSASTDALAMGLALWGVATCLRREWSWVVLGTVLIVLGGATKQTSLGFAAVPLLVLVSRYRIPTIKDLLMGGTPLAAGVLVLLMLRFLSPMMWRYVIVMPGSYHLAPGLVFKAALGLVACAAPIILLAGYAFRADGRTEDDMDPMFRERLRWLVCTAFIAILLSALSMGKAGGSFNSLMPAYFVLVALGWAMFAAQYAGRHGIAGNRPVQVATPLMFLVMLFPMSASLAPTLSTLHHERDEYRAVLSAARTLHGKVIAPRDPSIMLFGRGQHDRGYYPDLDLYGWPASIPEPILSRDYSADYVIDAPAMTGPSEVDALQLEKRGYTRIWHGVAYAIWKAPKAR